MWARPGPSALFTVPQSTSQPQTRIWKYRWYCVCDEISVINASTLASTCFYWNHKSFTQSGYRSSQSSGINHQYTTLMIPNKGETAVCGSSIYCMMIREVNTSCRARPVLLYTIIIIVLRTVPWNTYSSRVYIYTAFIFITLLTVMQMYFTPLLVMCQWWPWMKQARSESLGADQHRDQVKWSLVTLCSTR